MPTQLATELYALLEPGLSTPDTRLLVSDCLTALSGTDEQQQAALAQLRAYVAGVDAPVENWLDGTGV